MENDEKYLIYAKSKRDLVRLFNIENKDSNAIMLPKDDKLVSEFASDIGNHFANKNILFYRNDNDTIVRLKDNSKGEIVFSIVKPSEFITILENDVNTGYFKIDADKKAEEKEAEKEKKEKIKEIETEIKGVKKELNANVDNLKKREEATDKIAELEQNIKDYETVEDKKTGFKFVKKSCKKDEADIVLASSQFRNKIQKINTIFTIPIPILKDNKLITPKGGYDYELKSWLPEDAPKLDDNMDVEEAKETIDFIFREFCFKTERDKTNAIAGLLTPLCRGLYSRWTCRTPIVLYSANMPRCGKDYCAGISGIIYTGFASEETPISTDIGVRDEEFRKKITSVLLEGKKILHFSNNKGYLNSAQLEGLATKEEISDRLLGTNKNISGGNDLELSMSANTGLTYTTDLAKRMNIINLFYDKEDPNQREFETENLHQFVLDNRGKILSALWTLIKNWYDAGMPAGSKKFASYPEWSRVVGGIMETAGYNNPCETNENLEDIGGDIKFKNMKMLFEACYEKFKGKKVIKKDVIDMLDPPFGTSIDENFEDLFAEYDLKNRSDRIQFSKLFDSYINRILGGICLKSDGNKRASRRKYEFVRVDDHSLSQHLV